MTERDVPAKRTASLLADTNIFLIGPMGAGKSTVGRQLAELLGKTFIDLDQEIEQRTGATIALIFDVEGESGFRQRECAALAEFAKHERIVLATGGGAVLDADNRELLRTHGFVVWIDTPVDVQLRRLAHPQHNRPLLATGDRREQLQKLASERSPLYEEIADVRVLSNGRGQVAGMARQIADDLRRHWHADAALAPSA